MKVFFAALILLMGCAEFRQPCMTGFDLGTSVGRMKPLSRRGGDTYADVSATIHFNTTGDCRGKYQPRIVPMIFEDKKDMPSKSRKKWL